MTVDPKVYALAEPFIDDVEAELEQRFTASQKKAVTQRLAEAMQQAIEDECEAIREEWI